MLTESSRYNLGVAFSMSYRGDKWWILVAFVVCYSPLVCDSIWFLCRSCMIGTLNLAHLGNLWIFPPLMFIFSTIKDLKYSLQRDEFPC